VCGLRGVKRRTTSQAEEKLNKKTFEDKKYIFMKIYLHGGEGRKPQFFLGGQITKFSRPEFKGQKDLLFFQAFGIHCRTKIIFPLKNLFICTSICNDCDSYRHNHEILIFDFFSRGNDRF